MRSYSKRSSSVRRDIFKLSLFWIFLSESRVSINLLLIKKNWVSVINKEVIKKIRSSFHQLRKLFNVSKISGCICWVVVESILRNLLKRIIFKKGKF